MPLDSQARYIQLGELIATFPDLSASPISDETLRWCARLNALLHDAHDYLGESRLDSALTSLRTNAMTQTRYSLIDQIKTVAFNAFAIAELHAPPGIRGAFIPAGNAHDGLVAIGKVFGEARTDVLLVDPYMDHQVLSDYAVLAPETLNIRLLSDAGTVKSGFIPAVKAWAKQYPSAPWQLAWRQRDLCTIVSLSWIKRPSFCSPSH
jgi:hypothetical protein